MLIEENFANELISTYYIISVEFNLFFDIARSIGSFFWLTPLIWIAYYFLCGNLDYPAVLEKHIRSGKVWPYLPIYWKSQRRKLIRAASLFLFWTGNLLCACSLYYAYPNSMLLFAGLGLSIFLQIKIRDFGTIKIIQLQQERFFQIYSQLAKQAIDKGNEISDSELLAKTQWQQHNDLRLADKQGRLLAFLRGEAKL